MNPSTVDIKNYLLQQSALSDSSLDLTFGTNLFISVLPETSVITTALMDSPGGPAEPHNIYQPVIQILTRGLAGGYENAWTVIEGVVEELHTLSNTTLGGTKYIQLWKMSEIAHVGNDTKNRPIFSCSMVIKRAKTN